MSRRTQELEQEGDAFSLKGLSPAMASRSRAVRLTQRFVTSREPQKLPRQALQHQSDIGPAPLGLLGLGYSLFARRY